MTDSEQERLLVAQSAARELGYRLSVDEAHNIEPINYIASAFVHVEGQTTFGRFLAYGETKAEAAEPGLDALRDFVKRGEPWPQRD